jgi:hypothetical protein
MSKQTKTHWKKFTNPNYLGTYAIDPEKDLTATIRNVKKEKVTAPGGESDDCTVVYFEEDIKPLILNVTNAKQIERLYGTPYIEEWEGKKITVYVKDGIEAFGQVTTGLRIRPGIPQKEKPQISPERLEKMKEAIGNGEYTAKKANEQYDLTAKQALEVKDMEADNGDA